MPFKFFTHSVSLKVQAGVFIVQSKFEFTIKGELTYLQDQFVIVHNSVQILYLTVLAQIDESFETEAKEKCLGNLTCVPYNGGNCNIIYNCA